MYSTSIVYYFIVNKSDFSIENTGPFKLSNFLYFTSVVPTSITLTKIFSPDLIDKVSCALIIFDEQINRINNNIYFINACLEIGYSLPQWLNKSHRNDSDYKNYK